MRVLISGASGLVGTQLVELLQAQNHEVGSLSRGRRETGTKGAHVLWRPELREIDKAALEGWDGVIHLGGEPILGRWTDRKKRAIRDSRVEGTAFLSKTLARLDRKPSVLLTASAIGIYGDTGEDSADEARPSPAAGKDFLADVARDWESAVGSASQAGIRTAQARFGIILSRHGGALAAMLPPFRWGLGGPVGSGRQWMSWISNRDVARGLLHLLENSQCQGPFNFVAPGPVTNRDFSRALGQALRRPALLPVPEFAVKLLYGSECAEATVLRSVRVVPKRLQESGFHFDHSTVDQGLAWALSS